MEQIDLLEQQGFTFENQELTQMLLFFEDPLQRKLKDISSKAKKGKVTFAALAYARVFKFIDDYYDGKEEGKDIDYDDRVYSLSGKYSYFTDECIYSKNLALAVAKIYDVDLSDIMAFRYGIYLRGDDIWDGGEKRSLLEIRAAVKEDVGEDWRLT